MKLDQIITEANIAAKLKDPKMIKMLEIAMRHDSSLPKNKVAALGSAAFGGEKDPAKQADNTQKIVKLWSDLLDDSLRSTDYGDLSADGKFDDWLTRLYANGVVDYEDINGEGGDALGAWKALSIRGKLKEPHQDFNRFKNLRQIQQIVQSRDYREELRRIKDAEVIEKHKREKKETTLIDDDRFLITLPYNYGACYNFNNAVGFNASFCTGSSSGQRWFERYAPEGPIISIFDKQNQEDENGKWQMHAPTGQMNNGNQSMSYSRGDQKFAELYPGLMKKIIKAIQSKAEEIKKNSTDIVRDGYDVAKAIADIKDRLPYSYASEEKEAEPEAGSDNGPGTYLVTHTPSGRSARIPAESREDAIAQLQARHANINLDDFTIEKEAEPQA
jgi:hypothetical protein